MTETVHVSLSVLRKESKDAEEHYERVKAYHTALALQNAKRALESFFDDERRAFVVLDGDGIDNPDHRPPTHFRIIDGGKETLQFTRR